MPTTPAAADRIAAGESLRAAALGAVTRTCNDCPATLGQKNRSGRCRRCLARAHNADPAVTAARLAGIRRHAAKPEVRAASTARLAKYMASMPEEHRQRRREQGARNSDRLRAAGRSLTPEQRAENGRKRSATVLGWCPPEWRAKYKDLTSKGASAARAKAIVLDLIAGRPEPIKYAQQKAKLAWCPPARRAEYDKVAKALGAAEARRIIEADLTPFERQMARVAAGARLIDKPVLRRADPAFTLGGIASAAL